MPTKPKGARRKSQRGPGVLIKVTWPLLAEAMGVSIHTVKKWGCGRGRKFNPKDLASILRFWQARQG